MAPRSYTRGEPCEECGSTRYITSDDGYTYCQRGHQQTARGTAVAHGEEAGELVITGRKSRRKDSDAESIASTKSGLSAPKAFEQYLLCLQLILRKQLQWLISSQHLPEELEVLVRDLWALRLRKHQSRVSYDSGTETDVHSQQFSSRSEGDTSASDATKGSRSLSQRRRREKADAAAPSILDCLGSIYLACLLLREPVLVADLYRWMQSGEILYYSTGKEVPTGMKERLPATYQDMLEPLIMSKPDKMHKHVMKILGLFSKDFGMTIPPINHPPVLYRWVLELALPIECYVGSLRLCALLDFDFGFPPAAQVGQGKIALAYPEVRLMAVLVVTTKLLFPWDGVKRYPSSSTDLSALRISWSQWLGFQGGPGRERHRPFDHAEEMESEASVVQASNEKLDEYLAWAEQNVASEDVREHGRSGKDAEFRRMMFRMFPVDEYKEKASSRPRHSDQDPSVQSSPPTHHSLARGEVGHPQPDYRPRRASQDAANSGSAQYETRTAREFQVEAGHRADANRDSQITADRLSPALLSSSRGKPSTSTNTPRVTGSLSAKRIVEDKGRDRIGGAGSNDACNAHGVLDQDINRAGSFYRRFRSAEELRDSAPGSIPPVAKMFHERAADLVGISLEALVKAVFLVEELMLRKEEVARRKSAV